MTCKKYLYFSPSLRFLLIFAKSLFLFNKTIKYMKIILYINMNLLFILEHISERPINILVFDKIYTVFVNTHASL